MDNLPPGTFEDEHELNSKRLYKLPIYEYKDQIIELIQNNQIVIIQGHTGCGKTTQIPQFILNANLNQGNMIGVTQSRRIAAVSMAKRVSQEKESNLGNEVGYEIRFEKKCKSSTQIKYMTDGILLNECVTDKELKNYGVIMIDEAHERSLSSDILLGLLKFVAKKRNDLKLIIASATICAEKFSQFFNDAKILTIEGRLFPIQLVYENYQMDYISHSARLVRQIHTGHESGDILLFLTGEEDIEKCCKLLKNVGDLIVMPLYGAIDSPSQQEIFKDLSPGERKVVVATNIAETSITINGIRFVIDCGYMKQNKFCPRRGIETLETVRISKAQAEQRKGRSGRTDSGYCYRLYSENTYNNFIQEAVPEIKRKDLSEIYLRIIEFELNPNEFDFLDRPLEEELERSENELLDLKIITKDGKLTPMGKNLLGLPVEPRLGKVIMESLNNKCTNDVLKIMAMFSEKFIFRKRRYDRNKRNWVSEFTDNDGDHFTLLNIFNEYNKNKNNKNWCSLNSLDSSSMKNVCDIYNQLRKILESNKNNTIKEIQGEKDAIKRSLISGFFKNICVKTNRGAYTRLYGREVMFIHPQSSLFQSSPKIILFNEVRRTTKAFMHGVLRLDEDILKGFPRELEIINYPENIDNLSKFFT